MATIDELLNRVNDSIDALQEAQETILNAVAEIGNAVHKNGDETICGIKSFLDSPVIPNLLTTDDSGKSVNSHTLREFLKNYIAKTGGNITGQLGFIINALAGQMNAERVNITPIKIYDSQNNLVSQLMTSIYMDGHVGAALSASTVDANGNPVSSAVNVYAYPDGTIQAIAPLASESYGRDISVWKNIIDYAYKKNDYQNFVYIGGPNASDTSDLNEGRGLSESKPFASFEAAKRWALAHFAGQGMLNLVLNANMTWSVDQPEIVAGNIGWLRICSGATKRKLIIPSTCRVCSGFISFDNIELNCPDATKGLFSVNGGYKGGSPTLVFNGNVTFTGQSSAALSAFANGTIVVNAQIGGNITGKKYSVTNGGRLLTNGHLSYLVGSEDGVKDASAVVF